MDIHIINLGCARNQVDSEIMGGRLTRSGHRLVPDPEQAEAIVINTCCFIEAAAEESIDTILAAAAYKETGRCRRLVVTGCLPERYREALREALPEADVFLGTGAYDRVVAAIEGAAGGPSACLLPDPDRQAPQDDQTPRERAPGPTAYLKIAEGCDRHCTFCIIPKLRGRQKSRPLGAVAAEARRLLATGVQELVLVGQETTRYGYDLRAGHTLVELLEELSAIAGERWVRFMYGHPESLSEAIVETVASHGNLCSYFDIPIQHVSPTLLKRMGRPYDPERIFERVQYIRAAIPESALRTTVIVGFPGETEKDFEQLQDFIQAAPFDHLGVFTYSDAEDLASHKLPHHVPPAEARRRRDALMERQKVISEGLNQRYLHTTQAVLLETAPEPGIFVGRTMFQAPEVDGLTYVRVPGGRQETLAPGRVISARIVDTLEYDLVGEPL